ncbi:MAG: hypothetical protein HY925_13735, partial [Elusimicrobia bacterium]|nr:hypothetical protein [Elusimicrobiota bacterium]
MIRSLLALAVFSVPASAQTHVEVVPVPVFPSPVSAAAGAALRSLPSAASPLGVSLPISLSPVSVRLVPSVRPVALARAGALGSSERGLLSRIVAWNFDWDDNIFFMPTKIVLANTRGGAPREVTTGDYAKIRGLLGKPGEWEPYAVDQDSFKYFGGKYFLQHIREAVASGDTSWQGPSWKAFVEACSRPETARWTTIITARSASPEDMAAGLRYLQELGYLKYLPPLENLYGVGDK